MNGKRKFVIAAIVVLVVMAVAMANASASPCGDANDDGVIDMTDVMTILNGSVINEWAADVNCDGKINETDATILWNDLADYPYPGESFYYLLVTGQIHQ